MVKKVSFALRLVLGTVSHPKPGNEPQGAFHTSHPKSGSSVVLPSFSQDGIASRFWCT